MLSGKTKEKFEKFKDKFLSTVFPTDTVCLICGEELGGERLFSLCGECVSKLPYVSDEYNVCEKCGKPFFDEARFCLECQNHKKVFDRANSPFIYEGTAVGLVEGLKFQNKKYYAAPMGAFVAAEYRRRNYSADAVIPVPMFEKAEKSRGFNQSGLIGEAAAELLGLEIITGVLVKVRETPHQMGLSAYQRRKNLDGAFAVADVFAGGKDINGNNIGGIEGRGEDKNGRERVGKTDGKCGIERIKGKRILLVDDVITTGSTVNECAKVLIGAGAESVSAIAFCGTKYRLPRGDIFQETQIEQIEKPLGGV
jgi:predicted amidophosphoribosyltransferase